MLKVIEIIIGNINAVEFVISIRIKTILKIKKENRETKLLVKVTNIPD